MMSKYLDEPTSNLTFVELIKKYPCIYDCNMPDYNNRKLIEMAWTTIAWEVNESVAHCKERWKNLRTAFSRSMKKPPPGNGSNKRVKDYYLKDVMQFVRPFLKSKPRVGYLSSAEETESQGLDVSDNSNNSVDIKFDLSHLENFSQTNHASENANSLNSMDTRFDLSQLENLAQTTHAPTSNENSQKRDLDITPANTARISEFDEKERPDIFVKKQKISKNTENEDTKCFMDYKKTRPLQNIKSDLRFLKSLLPDIAKMNDYQKRQFKKRTLEVIDSILCDGP